MSGTRFSYNNVGYALLAQIVAKRSGQSFSAFVQERILSPLNMRDSFLCGSPAPRGAVVAVGYLPLNESWTARSDACEPRWNGPGGIYASLGDLVRFERAFRTGTILPAGMVQQALTNFTLTDGTKANLNRTCRPPFLFR